VLVRAWAPMFRISMGIPRPELEAMSVPVMLEHLDYLKGVSGDGD